MWIRKLTSKQAEPLSKETSKILMSFKSLIHTITGDNGKKFAGHEYIAQQLNLDFYFAHP